MFTTLSALLIVLVVVYALYKNRTGKVNIPIVLSLGVVGLLLVALAVWNATIIAFKVLVVAVLVGLLALVIRS